MASEICDYWNIMSDTYAIIFETTESWNTAALCWSNFRKLSCSIMSSPLMSWWRLTWTALKNVFAKPNSHVRLVLVRLFISSKLLNDFRSILYYYHEFKNESFYDVNHKRLLNSLKICLPIKLVVVINFQVTLFWAPQSVITMQVPVLSADYDVCDMRAVSHTTVLFPKIQDYKCVIWRQRQGSLNRKTTRQTKGRLTLSLVRYALCEHHA